MSLFRSFLGWGIAMGYVAVGARRRAVRGYDEAGRVLALYGHDPRPWVLEGVLGWLRRAGFGFVSTDELLAMQSGELPWRPRVAWLTFDDGWAGFEADLLPILEKYQAAATIFVAPGETARGQVWTNSISPSVPPEEISRLYGLAAEARYAAVDAVLAKIGNPRHLAPEAELRRLARHSLVTLENHTYSHLSCAHRPVAEVVAEVQQTQAVLMAWTGRRPRLCCYPFGHFTAATDEALRAEGLVPVHSVPGQMTLSSVGACRNLFRDDFGRQENLGRVLGAWVPVRNRRG